MKKILHAIFGHSWDVIAWSVMGNPIEQCTFCGQCAVTYGSINAQRTLISKKQMGKIRSEL